MVRTYRRDSRGRFAGNGNTSRAVRQGLQQATGVLRAGATNPKRIYAAASNRRGIKNTIAQSSALRSRNRNARHLAATPLRSGKPRPPRPNTYQKGRRPDLITETNLAYRPQRMGTISRSPSARSWQADLRSELKAEGRSMASFRKEAAATRRYSRKR